MNKNTADWIVATTRRAVVIGDALDEVRARGYLFTFHARGFEPQQDWYLSQAPCGRILATIESAGDQAVLLIDDDYAGLTEAAAYMLVHLFKAARDRERRVRQ